MDNGTGDWNLSLLETLFEDGTVSHILAMAPPSPHHQDSIIWTPDPRDVFTVKGAVQLAQASGGSSLSVLSDQTWKSFWRLPLQDRLKLLL